MTTVGVATVELRGDAAQFERTMQGASNRFDALARRAEVIGGQLTRALTLPLTAIGFVAGKAFIDFESSFAGIRKTMELTEAEFGRLEKANRDMARSIPVSVNELNRIGELAGQLGIRGVDNVLKFEDTIAKLAVTTDLTADTASLAFAQIANVMQLPQSQIDRLGASVVDLGNNFATTESRIVEFTQNIAGAGQIAGLTAADVAGIGAAFASLGIGAEAGGTAVQKVLIGMTSAVARGGSELETFARALGVTGEEFRAAFREDAAGVFVRFVEELGASGEQAIATLEELGLTDQRLTRAFLGAAGAGDLLRRAVDKSNTAWIENNALTQEARKRFETAESRIKVFRNRLQDVALTVGGAIVPVLTDLLDAMSPLVEVVAAMADAFAALPKPVRIAAVALGALAATIGPALLAFGALQSMLPTIGIALAALARVQLVAFAGAMITALKSVGSFTAALAVMRSSLTLLAVALGPAGWLVIGITAVAAAWRYASASAREHREEMALIEARSRQMTERLVADADNLTAAQKRVRHEMLAQQMLRAAETWQGIREEIARTKDQIDQLAEGDQIGLQQQKFEELASLETDLKNQEGIVRALTSAWTQLGQDIATTGTVAADAGNTLAAALSRGFSGDVTFDVLGRIIDRLDETRAHIHDLQFEMGLPQTAERAQELAEELETARRQAVALKNALESVGGEEVSRSLLNARPQLAKPSIRKAGPDLSTPQGRTAPQFQFPVLTVERILPGETMREALARISTLKQAFEDLGEGMQSIALAGIDAFAAFATGAGNAIGDFVRQAIRDMARLLARLAIIRGLQFLFPGSEFVDGLATLAGLDKKAAGGPVMNDRAYIVGERGPELFVPRTPGNILPNHALAGAGGGTIRFDMSSLPPYPRAMSPEALAVDDYWRRFTSAAFVDYDNRGGRRR